MTRESETKVKARNKIVIKKGFTIDSQQLPFQFQVKVTQLLIQWTHSKTTLMHKMEPLKTTITQLFLRMETQTLESMLLQVISFKQQYKMDQGWLIISIKMEQL